jgi:glutamate transport system substrate-binding protein
MRKIPAAVAAALVLVACGCASEKPVVPVPTASAAPRPAVTSISVAPTPQPAGAPPVVGVKVDQYGTGYLDVNNSDSLGNYNYTGFDVGIATYLSQKLFGQDPAFLPVSSATRETYLADGAVRFFAATYTIDQGRQKEFDLAGPYLVTAQGVMVGPHSPPITSLLDLNGKTVCVVGNGSESESILTQFVPSAHAEPANDYSDCLNELRDNDVQAFSTDLAILYGYMEQPGNAGLRVVPGVTMGNPIFYGVAFRKSDYTLCMAAAAQIKALADSDEWDSFFTSDLGDYASDVSDYQAEVKPTDQEIKDNSCKN